MSVHQPQNNGFSKIQNIGRGVVQDYTLIHSIFIQYRTISTDEISKIPCVPKACISPDKLISGVEDSIDTQDQKTILECKDKLMVAQGIAREKVVKASCGLSAGKMPHWIFDEYDPLPICPNGATYCDNAPTIECVEFSCESLDIDSNSVESGIIFFKVNSKYRTFYILDYDDSKRDGGTFVQATCKNSGEDFDFGFNHINLQLTCTYRYQNINLYLHKSLKIYS